MKKVKRHRMRRRLAALLAMLSIVYIAAAASPDVHIRDIDIVDAEVAAARWQYACGRVRAQLQQVQDIPRKLQECALRVEELFSASEEQ